MTASSIISKQIFTQNHEFVLFEAVWRCGCFLPASRTRWFIGSDDGKLILQKITNHTIQLRLKETPASDVSSVSGSENHRAELVLPGAFRRSNNVGPENQTIRESLSIHVSIEHVGHVRRLISAIRHHTHTVELRAELLDCHIQPPVSIGGLGDGDGTLLGG